MFEEKKQLLQLLWKPYKFFIFNFANIDIDQVLIRAVQKPWKTEKSIQIHDKGFLGG